jgi:hypothetical protein
MILAVDHWAGQAGQAGHGGPGGPGPAEILGQRGASHRIAELAGQFPGRGDEQGIQRRGSRGEARCQRAGQRGTAAELAEREGEQLGQGHGPDRHGEVM